MIGLGLLTTGCREMGNNSSAPKTPPVPLAPILSVNFVGTLGFSITAGRRAQGAVQGIASSAGAVASILGLLLGGILYASLQQGVFFLSALTILLVFGLSWGLFVLGKPENPSSQEKSA